MIDATGVIRMHHIGDINERVWNTKVGPLYNKLVAQAAKTQGADAHTEVNAVMSDDKSAQGGLQ